MPFKLARQYPMGKKVVEVVNNDISEDSSQTSVGSDDSKSDDTDTDSDVQGPQKVVFGFPQGDVSEESDSSGGVNVYGRAAQKTVSRDKKAKRDANKGRHFG